jgi:hypothetical protein
MPETAFNFQAGLRIAYNELGKEGKLSADAKQAVGGLIGVQREQRGRKLFQLIRSHRAVRQLYVQKTGAPRVRAINWTAIVEWIKANWVTILRIILTIAPLLLMDNRPRRNHG